MKTVMVLEGSGHDQQALRQLLRDHGYNATAMSESDWRAEEALRQSEQRYKSIYENAPVGIFRSTLDGKFISVNSAVARMLKYASPQELMEVVNRTSIAEVLYMDPCHRQEVLERILTRSGWRVCEERFRCKDGSIIEVIFHIRAVPGTVGGLVELEGFIEDITERKHKDEAQRFTQFAIDKTIDQAFWMTGDARFFYVNDAACQALGYSREELVGMSVPDIDPTFPAEVFTCFWRELKEKGSMTFEARHRSKDGRTYPVEIRANYVVFDGQEYNCAFATDISERKAAEEALRLTQFAIDKTPDQAFWGTPEGRFLYVNEAACAALGYSREELVGMSISDIDVDFSADGLIAQWQKLKRCGAKRFESHHRAKDGRIYPVEIRSNYVNFDGKEYRCAFATDISKRKQAEEALQESEQRYREVFENTSDCMFLLDVTADGRFKFAGFNPAEEKAVGLLSADTAGKFVEETIPKELADQVLTNYRRCVEAGTTITYEEQLNLPVGNRFFQTVLIPVRNAAAEIYRIIGIAHDTTESRRVEKELRLASLVVENSPAVLFRWRVAEGWPVEMVTRNINQFGYAPEELLSGAVPYAALVHPADFGQVEAEFQAHICRGENNFNREYRIITKQEEVRWVDERTLIERDAEGRVTHCQGIVIDITERKRAEEQVKASLAEKEVLLREIHHRVKNNLQVVSSLLYLQAQKLTDPVLQACFLESQNRICSMALAHEQLYQSKNLSEVSVKAYAENLVNQLCQIFHCPDQTIDCCLEVEDLELDIEKIIPCGLLITELLSNAYKHAFVDGKPGQITISIKKVGSEMGLSVADTGIGFPAEIDYLHARTLGLQLVTALVNQLNGTLELDRSRGTLFRVRFAG
ncbi:MAG: PAS domain S-box protein [Pedobacter sp.]